MTDIKQTIPCPVCKTGIPFDPFQLLMGVPLTCPGCGNTISLGKESSTKAKEQLDEITKYRKSIDDSLEKK
ncbi:hypothetical protein AMR72_05825 [Flavobacterium psychrophilum]|nr:hypothetical protein AMR72_05825 [Flavobacterium psychrophilum]AOE52079.1 hypothetical protein ALW18_05820 [Flavobacterium psychrophilum]